VANLLTLRRVWQILREVDLEAIRQEAEAPVRVLVIAETAPDADDLGVLLAGEHPEATEWVTSIDAPLAAREARNAADDPKAPVVDAPDLVLLVTRAAQVSMEMAAARDLWLGRKVPIVRVSVGSGDRAGKVNAHGNTARVAVDALNGEAVDHVAQAIFRVVGADKRLALAREFPALRACVFTALIDETARANAGYSFSTGLAEIIPLLDIPLNIGDVIVLTKNQLMMGYRIALAAGKQGTPRQLVGEIVGVLGGGLIFRQIARQLVGLVPVLGIVPKVAVAYGGTWAIGRAVALWATEGEKLTAERLRALSREGLSRGREIAKAMKRQTPAA
jgi:uncharacterized protein (DUF697 family)